MWINNTNPGVPVSPQLGAWSTTNLVKAARLFPRQLSHTPKIFLTADQRSPLDVQVSSCRSLKKTVLLIYQGKLTWKPYKIQSMEGTL